MAASPAASEPTEEFPFWRENMLTAFAGATLANLGFSASYPYLPLMVKEMGFTSNLETWVGLLVWLFFTFSLLVTPLWGVLADHFGKKTMVLRAGFGMGRATPPRHYLTLLGARRNNQFRALNSQKLGIRHPAPFEAGIEACRSSWEAQSPPRQSRARQ